MNRRRVLLACTSLAAGLAVAAAQLLPVATPAVSCGAPAELTRIDAALGRSAAAIAATGRLSIVAIGSSSTKGTGASSPTMNYPARLQQRLQALLPGVAVSVVNRGIGGQDVGEEVARLSRDVLALNPDLAIWQLGTNAVLRRDDLGADAQLIRRGVALLAEHRIDVVLMDLQYAPRVERRPAHAEMERIIAEAARRGGVGLFHRYALMQRWAATGQFGQTAMIGRDGLHMTDASYGCLATELGDALIAGLAGAAPARSAAAVGIGSGFTIW